MNEQPGAPLSSGRIASVRRGCITLCAAFLKAGFSPSADLVALSWEEDGGVAESGKRPQDIRRATLSDPDATTRIIVSAIGTYPGGDQTFSEWELTASARVGVVDDAGCWQSIVATFDTDNAGPEHQRGSRKIRWDDAGKRYNVEIVGIGEDEPEVLDDDAEGDLRNWSGLTRLIEAAGGDAREMNFVRRPGEIANFVFRFGFLSAPAVDDGNQAVGSATIPRGTVGGLSLMHLYAMGRFTDEDERAELIDRLTIDVSMIELADRKLPYASGRWDLLFKMPGFTGKKPFSYLAPGIPKGGVTLFAGASGSGKSTLMHHCGLIVATPPEVRDPALTWCGVPASEVGHGTVVYLSLEDDESAVSERHLSLGYPPYEPDGMIALPYDGRSLDETLKDIEAFTNLALIVVDPISSFFEGSVIDDWTAAKIMRPLMNIAREKQCVVVGICHLQKNANPSTLSEVKNQIIGSQKFYDNARAVIAVAKSGGATIVGTVKLADPALVSGALTEQRLRFNPTNKHLVPWSDAEQVQELVAADPDADVTRVLQALRAASLRDKRFTRSGDNHGVYEAKLPELAGMPRAAVRDAVDMALRSGALRAEGKFLVPVMGDDETLPPSPPMLPGAATATATT